jgi:ubiquinone/menaquinone biosynthesis C-methylase UbiE
MAPASSRSFDRAVSYYDRTRGLPAETAAELNGVLLAALTGREPCLEIGVGTGRIALPLQAAGVAMVGADLSLAMMSELVRKAGGRAPFPLAQADATRLPFADGRFGSAMASHVLHLIPDWRAALAELRRVLRPGGRVIVSERAGHEGSLRHAVTRRFRAEAGRPARDVGVRASSSVTRAFRQLGAHDELLPEVTVERTDTLDAILSQLDAGQWSWTWSLPADVLHDAAERTRAWALDRFGSAQEPRVERGVVRFRAFDLPLAGAQ